MSAAIAPENRRGVTPDGRVMPEGKPWRKGESGNPWGRPKKVRELEEAIEKAHGPKKVLEVIAKLHSMALAGDLTAIKLYLDRVAGPVRPILQPEVNLEDLTDEALERRVGGR